MTRREAEKQLVRGAVVRLKHDFHTRGHRVYRAGVKFKVASTREKYYLRVRVRGQTHHICMNKKDALWWLESVSVPAEPEADD